MSAQVVVTSRGVNGLSRARDDLKRVDAAAAKELRIPALAAASLVAEEARTRAPVRSGALQRSIRGRGSQRGASVRAGNAKVPYAAVMEFGGTIPVRSHPQVRRLVQARPYLYPAIAAKSDEVIRVYEAGVATLLRAHGL